MKEWQKCKERAIAKTEAEHLESSWYGLTMLLGPDQLPFFHRKSKLKVLMRMHGINPHITNPDTKRTPCLHPGFVIDVWWTIIYTGYLLRDLVQ